VKAVGKAETFKSKKGDMKQLYIINIPKKMQESIGTNVDLRTETS
jgi:hypothetical protein